MKRILFLAALLFTTSTFAVDLNSYISKADAFFAKNVKNGLIDYDGIQNSPGELNELMKMAECIRVSESDANNYQAFWINTYNLTVIKGIVENFPTNSPLDIPGFFDSKKYSLGGKQVTLNQIEKSLLIAKFKDPRFHFVLVCGALGCPPIVNKAYKPSTLDAQMNAQTKKALNGNFLKVNNKKKTVQGSEILKWYKGDFTMSGSEIDFINQYRTEKIPSNYKLCYFTYNWKLNKQ